MDDQPIISVTTEIVGDVALVRIDNPLSVHARAGLQSTVADVPEKKAQPRDVNAIGVIGGGTMGSGIATSALLAGIPVTLIEVKQEALDKGVATITGSLDGAVKRGKLSAEKRDATLAMLSASNDLQSLAEVDLVIEAVFEKMEIKKEFFGNLDTICKPGAIHASNTSYLDINEIATATDRPEDVIGLHFLSPAHVMKLLEIVAADKTAPEVTATVFALDIGWMTRQRKVADMPSSERYVGNVADRICENGWFGRKTGQGYYVYEGRDMRPNPEMEKIIAAEREKAGITPRDFTDQDIVDRYMTVMIVEATRVVEGGIALRPAPCRCGVPVWLRFPPLPRRPAALCRHHRRRRTGETYRNLRIPGCTLLAGPRPAARNGGERPQLC